MSEQSIQATVKWLEQWVIGLNLCPFARYPYAQGKVRIVSIHSTDEDNIFREVLGELDTLYQQSADEIETTLVVVENGLQSFNEYLGMLGLLESVLPQTGLEGVIQVASFHPQYCFDGVDENDVSNFTNRSPYPLFHLIREASLTRALESYPDVQSIPQTNIELMQSMGIVEVRKRLRLIAGA